MLHLPSSRQKLCYTIKMSAVKTDLFTSIFSLHFSSLVMGTSTSTIHDQNHCFRGHLKSCLIKLMVVFSQIGIKYVNSIDDVL